MKFYLLILLVSASFSAPSLSYNYQLRWASGSELNEQGIDGQGLSDYGYLENLVAISGYIYNDWFVSLDFEYSPEPAYGASRKDIKSMPTSFFIERQTDKLYFKLGTLNTLYGQGMALNLVHDQVRDFNNTVTGLELSFDINDNLKILSVLGVGVIKYRSNVSFRETDLSADARFISVGAEYYHDNTGSSAQYFFTRSSVGIGPENIYAYRGIKTSLGLDLSYRLSNADRSDGLSGGLCLLEPGSGTIFDCEISDDVISYKHDFVFDTSIGNLGLFLNAQLDRYQKIYNEDFTNGYNLYMAMYSDVMGWGVTTDLKSYYSPFKLQMISSKPTVYREVNSTLLSRASHFFSYNNEHGFQINLTRYLYDDIFLNVNYAFSRRYALDTYDANNMEPVRKGSSSIWDMENYPYSQFFIEASGYFFEDKFFYKVGYDNYYENKCEKGIVKKNTLPLNFSFAFNDRFSLSLYSEIQQTIEEFSSTSIFNNMNYYLASSISYKGKFIVTLMSEAEKLEYREDYSTWSGINLTMYPLDSVQMELFYGSIKGGLVCANGVCAVQPGFVDGFKVLFRTSF